MSDAVRDRSNGSQVHEATVAEVKTHKLWLLGKSVTFVLDYTDPAAKSERGKQAEGDKKREQAQKNLEASEGKTAKEGRRGNTTCYYTATDSH